MSGLTTCVNVDTTNSVVFGLSTLVRNPDRSAPSRVSSGLDSRSTLSSARARKVRIPIHTRYAAPASLIAVNRVVEEAIRRPTPSIVYETCTSTCGRDTGRCEQPGGPPVQIAVPDDHGEIGAGADHGEEGDDGNCDHFCHVRMLTAPAPAINRVPYTNT